MDINFLTSSINRIIIHRVFKKKYKEDIDTVEYNDILVDASPEVHDTLKNRLVTALGKESKSFKLEIADFSEDSFFNFARSIKNCSEEEFIQISKDIASKLAESQYSKRMPGGFVLVIDGVDMYNQHFVVVIKAELQEAFKTSVDSNTGIPQIELVKDIFLSPAIKFFKIGMLHEDLSSAPNPNDPRSGYTALLFDEQFKPQSKLAEYFYGRFLGFSIDSNDKILSKTFYDDYRGFVIRNVNDYVKKESLLKLIDAFYLQESTFTVDPADFADNYLAQDEELRAEFDEQVLPKYPRPFTRDTTLLNNELRRTNISFPNDIKVVAPKKTFEEHVKVFTTKEEILDYEFNGGTILHIAGKPYTK